MSSLVTIIKNIIETIPVDSTVSPATYLNFYYGAKSIQNKQDDITLPVVLLDYPIISLDEFKQSGSETNTFPIGLFFCDKVANLDSEIETISDAAEAHRTTIDKAWEWSRQFKNRCIENSNLFRIDGVKRTEQINIFDTNLSGVFMECKLIVLNGLPICID